MLLRIIRSLVFILLMVTIAVGKDKTPRTYQQGTITGGSAARESILVGLRLVQNG
jgi:hypothetical protein